jgi:hemoglobin/transferrin/lactoferrin receptor protein
MPDQHSLLRPFISFFSCVLVLTYLSVSASAQDTQIRGTVADEGGGAILGARLVLHTTQGAPVQETYSGADGTFALGGMTPGSYWLEVTADQFARRRVHLDVGGGPDGPREIRLSVAPFGSEVTVTAERGTVSDIRQTTSLVTVREQDGFRERPLPTIANALTGATGVMVQQSTYGQASPFLRGLTGYQVLNLIDGVRFNNSTFRSGPNQYLAFADPSQAQRIEAMLGPSSSQFGSDAMGGTIQLLTPAPEFAGRSGLEAKGGANLFAATADGSGGGDATVTLRGAKASVSVGGVWRDMGDLRAGGGGDSHHVLTRLFGLSGDQVREINDGRQTGTGFRQSGAHARFAARPGAQQNVTAWYQGSETTGVRGYKDLWGGLGRVRSDFEPQRLHFFYGRYETLGVRGLDSLSGTFSVNSQTDGSVRQGLKATDAITDDDVQVDQLGYAVQATTHFTSRHDVVFGGEIYDEGVDARRDVINPQTGGAEQRRALYPNGSTYRTSGLFAQDALTIVPDRLRAVLGGRFTRVDVETRAASNRSDAGRDLGVVDSSQSYQDWTYNAGLTWRVREGLDLNFLTGRGFRAPNLNDLGALGLNDLGYEIPASAALGGQIGASDGEGALSTGRPVSSVKAERLFNYEVGTAVRWRQLYSRVHVFDAELSDPIVRRTLVFPLASLPTSLAGVPVAPIATSAAQREQGVGSVATSLDPRAVKAFVNEGRSRYYGVDALFSYRIATRWLAEANYSYLVGHDLNPQRPVRRLPPQQGFFSLRYQPGGRLAWVEVSAHASGAQKALSGGDLTDERIGAGRRRSDITDFFQGSLVSPYILPGGDGRLGTADDLFGPTGETAAQIRDRVLPLGATINGVTVVDDGTRVPLFTTNPAFVSVNLGAGLTVTRNIRLNIALMNVADRNYRIHGSGVDAPGASLFARLHVTF